MITTDKQMGGESEASIKLVPDGADNSHGALEISGQIKPGFSYPWAGAFFVPGKKSRQAINYSKAKELVFWVKGDGRKYAVMTFSTTQAAFHQQSFTACPQWHNCGYR